MSNIESQNRATAILANVSAQASLIAKISGMHPPHIVKQTVGLTDVDNTADAVKIVSTPQATAIAAALASANSHSDANDATTLQAGKDYTDGKWNLLNALVGDGSAQTLLFAETYTNVAVQNATTVLETYTNDAVAAGVASSKGYSDAQIAAGDTATLASANSNTASVVDSAVIAANAYADNSALTAQSAAQTFATSAITSSATSVLATSETYTDHGVASAIATAQAYADAKVAGLLDNRGVFYPISEGTSYPTDTSGIGGSGASGTVAKSDFWFVGEEITVNGKLYTVGDIMFSMNDAPGQADANWDGLNTPLSYVPVSIADRATVIDVTNISSEVIFPSNKAFTDYIAANYVTLETANSMMSVQESQNAIILTMVAQISALQDALAGI